MKTYGVLVISHGSRNEEWVKLVDEAVQQVKLPTEVPIVSSFLEIVEGRLIQDGIDQLEAEGVTDIITVPLFVSSGSIHVDEIRYALGLQEEPTLETDLTPFRIQVNISMCDPIDDDPIVANIMYSKIIELSERPEQEIVLLVGHGSKEEGFHEQWQQGMDNLAVMLKQLGGFAEVDTAMLLPNQLPGRMEWWQKHRPSHKLIIAPLFLSEGYFTEKVIPSRLEGLNYRYNGKTMLPSPQITHWMEGQLQRFFNIK